jgi:hypothetical protein
MAYSKKEIESIFETICDKIENEGLPISRILNQENMPSYSTFYIWLNDDETKSKRYARATEVRAEKIFDEILDISDSQEGDVYIDKDGKECINHNIINRARLRVDARKWILSKMNPKKFSDKSQQDINITTEQPIFPDV